MGKASKAKRRRRTRRATKTFSKRPTYSEINGRLQSLAIARGDLGGYPMPLEGQALTVAPGFPYPDMGKQPRTDPEIIPQVRGRKRTCREEDVDEDLNVVNQFWSRRLQKHVYIYRGKDGLSRVAVHPKPDWIRRLDFELATYHAALAWEASAERKAMEKLRDHIGQGRWDRYCMTGGFVETSQRSGIMYVFRRLRPTMALSNGGGWEFGDRGEGLRIIATLCLHPIAYYEDTFAGGMVPTDDVLAHLLLMRGDEHLFWKRANQHPQWIPNSGI